MYAVTSMPLVKRTRATLRRAEFGFFGVVVYTRVHTPRRCGAPLSAGVLPLAGFDSRPFRTNCWMVGTEEPFRACGVKGPVAAATGRGWMLGVRGDRRQTGHRDSAGVAAGGQIDDLGVGLGGTVLGLVAVAGHQVGSSGQPFGQIGLVV